MCEIHKDGKNVTLKELLVQNSQGQSRSGTSMGVDMEVYENFLIYDILQRDYNTFNFFL